MHVRLVVTVQEMIVFVSVMWPTTENYCREMFKRRGYGILELICWLLSDMESMNLLGVLSDMESRKGVHSCEFHV